MRIKSPSARCCTIRANCFFAAAADRRKPESEDASYGFDKEAPLESIFNILNKGNRKQKLPLKPLDNSINFPSENAVSSPSEYKKLTVCAPAGIWYLLKQTERICGMMTITRNITGII